MSEDKPKRSYAKASYKTKPYTVRFDIEKFNFFMSREKLETAQQLVDHFLNGYWWQWKVAKPTHRDVPPVESLPQPVPIKQKVSVWDEQPKQQMPTYKTPEQFKKEKRECETEEDWLKLKAEIENSNLSAIQKNLLIKYN